MEDNVIMKPLREQFQIILTPLFPKQPFSAPLKHHGLSTLEVIIVHILN